VSILQKVDFLELQPDKGEGRESKISNTYVAFFDTNVALNAFMPSKACMMK
jgi:hypothetical protein